MPKYTPKPAKEKPQVIRQIPPLRISEEEYQELFREAQERGHTISGYVRWAIKVGRAKLRQD